MVSKRSTPKSTKSLKSGRPPLLLSSSTPGGGKGFSGPSSSSSSWLTTTTTRAPPRTTSISSRHTRTVIRKHHALQKRLSRARADDDLGLARQLESEIEASGGLATYQLASAVGQSAERGGDSSRVLVRWIKQELDIRRKSRHRRRRNQKEEEEEEGQNSSTTTIATGSGSDHNGKRRPKDKKHPLVSSSSPPPPPRPLRILEIGALSTTNALNVVGATDVRRIDLRSSVSGVEEIDFMSLPLPDDPSGDGSWKGQKGYDVISLSLVLNYVPGPRGRGEMLKRTTRFFTDCKSDTIESTTTTTGGRRTFEDKDEDREEDDDDDDDDKSGDDGRRDTLLPCLFLVLPAPTVHNSRYLTPPRLDLIMSSLGYVGLVTKTTQKLFYGLWRYDPTERDRWVRDGGPTVFPKREINPGAGRNNFCIVVD